MGTQSAIAALYDTVFEPEAWGKAAVECARLVHGATLFIQIHNIQSGQTNVISGHGLETLGIDAYESYYHRVDIWKQGLIASARDQIHLYHEMVSQADYENSEVFNDWVKPGVGHDVYWGIGSALSLWDKHHVAFLASHRARRQGEMTEGDRAAFAELAPHLQRALQLRRLVDVQRVRGKGLETICDSSRNAALLVDERGRVVYANIAAVVLLRLADGLRLCQDGSLEAVVTIENQSLRRQIAAACGTAMSDARDIGEPLKITRREHARPLIVTVGPVPADQFPLAAREAIVFIEDIWTGRNASPKKIMLALGVTRAEARLIAALAEGLTLVEAAGRLGVSYNTGRAQLRSVLGKTGLGRQSELMLHVARLS